MIAALLLLSSTLCAQPAVKGYIVRVDSQNVWLDLAAADGASAGRGFEVYKEGEVLKHPITGEVLGKVETKVAAGTITSVADRFSTGIIKEGFAAVRAGLRARLVPLITPTPATAPAVVGEPGKRIPKSMSASLNYQVAAMAVGYFDESGKPQIALASETDVRLYAYPAADAKPFLEAPIQGTGVRIVGLEAARLDGDKKDSLLVAVYDDSMRRFATRVMKFEDGKLRQIVELGYLTRAYQNEKGERVIATEQVFDDKTFPFGKIYPLAYKDGRYEQGRPALSFRRLDWIFGFTTAALGKGDPALLYYTAVHALRAQFGKEWWRTPDDDYGQTPLRVRFQDHLLEFHPPMAVLYDDAGKFQGLYALRNMAALGGLASPFGLFNRGVLVRKSWNGLGFSDDWTAELPGCAQGLAIVETEPGKKELAVAIRGSAGQSSIWTFDL